MLQRICAALPLILFTTSAYAASITVDVFTDTSNLAECSLRDAITAANTDSVVNGCVAGTSGMDVIDLAAGTFVLTNGVLQSNTDISIFGEGPSETFIDAQGNSRIFEPSGGLLRLTSLNLSNGGSVGEGGAIRATSDVLAVDVYFDGNSAVGGGGAIYIAFGTTTLTNSVVENSTAGRGAVFVGTGSANLVLTRSIIRNNTVTGTTSTNGHGGALHIETGGSVLIEASLLSNNSALREGGAIWDEQGMATVSIINSTIANNQANVGGAFGGSLLLELAHSTVAGNTATASSGFVSGDGTYEVVNSLIANNSSGDGTMCGLTGTVTTERHNLLDDTAGCSTLFNDAADLLDVDPLLGPLLNFGGPTLAFEPGVQSPALFAGDCTDTAGVSIAQDQLYRTRSSDGMCTIGAVEFFRNVDIIDAEEPAGSNCPAGGLRLDLVADENGDGVTSPDEISTEYVCDGVAGADGADGTNGTDGSDGTNGSNGADGADGADGTIALLDVQNEAAGQNCAAGGQRIDAGVDSNANGSLDAGEVTSTSYLCNGQAGSNGADGEAGGCASTSSPVAGFVALLLLLGWRRTTSHSREARKQE